MSLDELGELERMINRNPKYKLCTMTRKEAMALIACVRAADAMRAERMNSTYIPVQAMRDYDDARARLAAP